MLSEKKIVNETKNHNPPPYIYNTYTYNFVSTILEPFHGASPYIYNTYKYNFVSAILEPFHGASPYI